MADRRRISKLLSLILRHRPDEFGLNVDEYGFAPLDEVVEAVQQRYSEVTEEDVRGLIEDSRQRRFEIRDGNIRALYAHSFFVEMDGEPMEPPERMYMAAELPAARTMKEEGIRPVDRFYLHLSKTREIAEERASQLDEPCMVEILAREAQEQGIEFYERGEVVLTRELGPELVGDLIEVEPSARPESRRRDRGHRRDGERSREDRPRGRGGRDRDRDGGRGRDRDGDGGRERRGDRERRDDRPRGGRQGQDQGPAAAPTSEPVQEEPKEMTYGRKPRRLAAGARR